MRSEAHDVYPVFARGGASPKSGNILTVGGCISILVWSLPTPKRLICLINPDSTPFPQVKNDARHVLC